jgi:hypothetical protein
MKRLESLIIASAILGVIVLGTAGTASASGRREPTPLVSELRAPGQEHGGSSADGEGGDVSTRVIWTIAGVAGGVVIFGTLYLLKRRLGGFPQNPTWVAPITIMPSRENADDTTWGDGDVAGAHGSHH